MTVRDNLVTRHANRRNQLIEETHSTSEMRGMFGALERLGYDLDSLLASARLSRSVVQDSDAQIPARACATVFTNAYRQRRVKNLALRLAVEIPLGANPLLDYIVASSESVGEGLRRLRRYLRLVNPAVSIQLCEMEEPVRVIVESPSDAFGAELTVSLSVLRMRDETGGRLKAAGISFCHEPEDAAEFERLLGCPVRTQSSWSGWALSQEAWKLPLRRNDPRLRKWLESKADLMLAHQSSCPGVTDEVRRVLAARLAEGDMRIEAVAAHLAMAPRTLQRRLTEEGTSYNALRDEVRKEVAKTLLADATLSIAETTYLLGFSEPTAFHRAFKRWHSTTPQAFRDKERIRGCPDPG